MPRTTAAVEILCFGKNVPSTIPVAEAPLPGYFADLPPKTDELLTSKNDTVILNINTYNIVCAPGTQGPKEFT